MDYYTGMAETSNLTRKKTKQLLLGIINLRHLLFINSNSILNSTGIICEILTRSLLFQMTIEFFEQKLIKT